MKYLLDTHAYLWFRSLPQRLPPKTFDLLTDTSHLGCISVITPWEIAIKAGAGKLDAASLLIDFERKESAAGFLFTGITTTQAIQSGLLPRYHRDPFDRLLIAQALDMGIPIVTNDSAFDLYGVHRIWD
jgi:PIN domain nuclease of toxin-antitoxin system